MKSVPCTNSVPRQQVQIDHTSLPLAVEETFSRSLIHDEEKSQLHHHNVSILKVISVCICDKCKRMNQWLVGNQSGNKHYACHKEILGICFTFTLCLSRTASSCISFTSPTANAVQKKVILNQVHASHIGEVFLFNTSDMPEFNTIRT